MTITKCQKCGELIHESEKCLFCGNTTGFTTIDSVPIIHENVKDEYIKFERFIKQGKGVNALDLSDTIMKWMPFCAEFYWGRLLARHNCSTDRELVCKGFSNEDPDYCNALLYANEIEKKVYLRIASKTSDLKDILIRLVTEHEYSEKNKTPILSINTEFTKELDERRQRLLHIWDELKKIEGQILSLEKDCLLLTNEYKETLQYAKRGAEAIKNAAFKVDECTIEELHSFQTHFGKLLYQSEQAKGTLNSMRSQHPWMKTYDSLVKNRDELIAKIKKEIDSLKKYESKVQLTVAEIEKIESLHNDIRYFINNWNLTTDFRVRDLLGESQLAAALVEAGIR